MYSPPHHNSNLDLEDEDTNRNSTEEERENSEDADDSWDQVLFFITIAPESYRLEIYPSKS